LIVTIIAIVVAIIIAETQQKM